MVMVELVVAFRVTGKVSNVSGFGSVFAGRFAVCG